MPKEARPILALTGLLFAVLLFAWLGDPDAPDRSAALTAAAGSLLLLCLPFLAVLTAAVKIAHALEHRGEVHADARGLLPFPPAQARAYAAAALSAWHQTQYAAATQGIGIRDRGLGDALPTPNPQPPTPAAAPSFAALLASGAIGPGQPLILGFVDGQALTGSWRDLYSSAVAGLSGSGKTTTLRYLAAQSALQGGRFLILDPHADAGAESLAGTLAPLAGCFLAAPASDPAVMLKLLRVAGAIMQDRLAGRAAATWPLILCVDEFSALMGRADLAGPLATLIEAVAQEGRKVAVFALISGQAWTVDRAGGSALRDALASVYAHRLRRNQGRLLLPAADAARAESLPPGRALLARASGEVIEVAIPQTTAADVAAVAARLPPPAGAPPSPPAPTTRLDAPVAPVAPTPPAVEKPTPPAVPPQAQEALDLFARTGGDLVTAIEQTYTVSRSNPGAYRKAYQEVQGAIRAYWRYYQEMETDPDAC